MKKILSILFFTFSLVVYSQNDAIPKFTDFTTVELALGKTMATNSGFPELNLNKTIFLSFGKTHREKKDEWAYRLNYPRTGMSFALTNYGNPEYMGYSVSVSSFIEYNLFKKFLRGLTMQMAGGAAYFTYNYKDLPYAFNNYPENNNRAISTKLTWSFRMHFNYAFLNTNHSSWKAGVGIYHQSNGHTNIPNDALNTVFFSVSRQHFYTTKKSVFPDKPLTEDDFKKSSNYFVDLKLGLGLSVLSEEYNDRNGVYSFSGSFGKTYNNLIKVGIGMHYRFYQNYYNYIKDEGELVVDEYPHFMDDPFKYATNIGAFGSFELLLGHFGLEAIIGYNIYKPFYEVDYQLQQGFYWDNSEYGQEEFIFVYGELEGSYHLKNAMFAKGGVKYYFKHNETKPKSNFYIGAHINSNFGEADFSEITLGYIYNFGFK